MRTFALRLHPGQDPRRELAAFAREHNLQAAFVLTCVGSLRRAALRLANQPHTDYFDAKYEICSLVGTLSPDGPHLHVMLSDGRGVGLGGHLQEGSEIYTTAEIVLGELEDLSFSRPIDPETTYDELLVSPRAAAPGGETA
ncbi:MAG: DNA-binding protein [Anaerolineales bacterium]|nr:DNA-binding protein [Anaerolineales bacterium]